MRSVAAGSRNSCAKHRLINEVMALLKSNINSLTLLLIFDFNSFINSFNRKFWTMPCRDFWKVMRHRFRRESTP